MQRKLINNYDNACRFRQAFFSYLLYNEPEVIFLPETNIDWSFINKIKKHTSKLSKTAIYTLLRQNKLIKKDGTPTQYAENNGLLGNKPLRRSNIRTPYRRFLALIPNNYLTRLKASKSSAAQSSRKVYLDLRNALLNKKLSDFTFVEWLMLLAVAYRGYLSANNVNPTLASTLNAKFNQLCQKFQHLYPKDAQSNIAKQKALGHQLP